MSASLIQTALWIGSEKKVVQEVSIFLKSVFCSKQGCDICINCRNIDQRAHYAVRWFYPENMYTIATLEPLFKTMAFALEDNTHFFFIIERAELLSSLCANSLLKSLEEPPAGYHFILSAPSAELVLPTIRSRCVIRVIEDSQTEHHTLAQFFIQPSTGALPVFVQELDRVKVSERDIPEFVDGLLQQWHGIYQEAVLAHDQTSMERSQKAIAEIMHMKQMPPMPGSAKFFLKSLYLRLKYSEIA